MDRNRFFPRKLILKLVNLADQPQSARVELSGVSHLAGTATKTVLTGDPMAINKPDSDKPLVPDVSTMGLGTSFDYPAPAHSRTIIRIKRSSDILSSSARSNYHDN